VTAAEVAVSLGGPVRRSGRWWRCICPVHRSRTGRSLTLAMHDDRYGLVVHCHAGCSRDDILAELRRRGLIGTQCGGVRQAPETLRTDDDADIARRIALASRIWYAARDPRGTPIVHYLASRGITIPPPPSLRWAPLLRRPDGTHAPAMVARVDSLNGKLIGVHRTWLYRDDGGQWRRSDRASLGPIGGGAVPLAPAAEILLIGEGIETVLAAMQATGQPAWAALSTSSLVALQLPPIVRDIVILADHDRSGAGGRAAWIAADRWLAEGRRVRIALPPERDTDFADVLARRTYASTRDLRDVAA
jgi:putative DNA primase/helicase